jgi:hypothetical protein
MRFEELPEPSGPPTNDWHMLHPPTINQLKHVACLWSFVVLGLFFVNLVLEVNSFH